MAVVGVPPTFNVVAAPKALTVVATVLNAANVALDVRTEVISVGEVPNTHDPEPVSSVSDKAN